MKYYHILLFSLFTLSLTAQSEDPSSETHKAITATLMDYIEGTSNGEPDRVTRAFHKDLNLYSVNDAKGLKVWNGQDYISRFQPGKKNNRKGKIIFIDFVNDAATAKVEITSGHRTFTDYFLLLKLNDHWKIVHKSYTSVVK